MPTKTEKPKRKSSTNPEIRVFQKELREMRAKGNVDDEDIQGVTDRIKFLKDNLREE